MRVLARDASGALVYKAGRFVVVTGLEAKAQLLRERVALQVGDDRVFPLRGTDWRGLARARATPQAAGLACAQDLSTDPLVRTASVTPRGEGFVAGSGRSAWALEGTVVLRNDADVVLTLPLEIPING